MKINKKELLKALELVKPGLGSDRDKIEQTTSFAFIDGLLVTFNDEISIKHSVPGLKGITAAIQAKELYAFLHKVSTEEISLETEGNELKIAAGRSRVRILIQAEIRLPLEEVEKSKKWNPIEKEHLNAMSFSLGCAAKNEGNTPMLTSIHILGNGNVEAADQNSAIRIETGLELEDEEIFIKASSVREIIKLSPTEYNKGRSWISFRNKEGTVISCRVEAGNYPDISRFLELDGEKIELPKSLTEILDRANIFAIAESIVSIEIKNRNILVKSNNDIGYFEEDARIKYKGEPLSFMITSYLLQRILKESTTCIIGDKNVKGKQNILFLGDNWKYVTVTCIQ